MKKFSLVLFDIDGTLIRNTNNSVLHWQKRLQKVFQDIYGLEIGIIQPAGVNGKLERRYFREIANANGIPDDVFYRKYPAAVDLFHVLLRKTLSQNRATYTVVEGARELIFRIGTSPFHHMGLVSGNIELNAWLKLKSVGLAESFEVGAFGDAYEDRSMLVLAAIAAASERFERSYTPQNTIVIGDTTHDILSAKHVGAHALGVTTGFTDDGGMLAASGADLVVDSLMDERVLSLLGLTQ